MEVPSTMAELDKLSNIVAVLWKVGRVVAETDEVVRANLRREEVGEVEVTGVDFLLERVRYNCMTWDLWNWMVQGLGDYGVREFRGCALLLMFLFIPSIYISGGAIIFLKSLYWKSVNLSVSLSFVYPVIIIST